MCLHLYCFRVSGKPIPDIAWMKDGIKIENNPDYRTAFVDGMCSLIIDETFVDDSAIFTCQASSLTGFAQTSATLKVEGTFLALNYDILLFFYLNIILVITLNNTTFMFFFND